MKKIGGYPHNGYPTDMTMYDYYPYPTHPVDIPTHTHSHTQLKKSETPHTHTQSLRGFPVKTGKGSDNTYEASLFVISTQKTTLPLYFQNNKYTT